MLLTVTSLLPASAEVFGSLAGAVGVLGVLYLQALRFPARLGGAGRIARRLETESIAGEDNGTL